MNPKKYLEKKKPPVAAFVMKREERAIAEVPPAQICCG